jgi:hypothetical protein
MCRKYGRPRLLIFVLPFFLPELSSTKFKPANRRICFQSSNRLMSPTSPKNAADMTTPMPFMLRNISNDSDSLITDSSSASTSDNLF